MALFTQQAVKEQLKARVAIDGPTGSGKTWTALQWAAILCEPGCHIGLIDTENRSAAYYAPSPGESVERLNPWDPPYEFFHLPVRPPYDPRDLARMIDAAPDDLGEGGVLIIDSGTHYWNGEGGTLDIVDNASSRGNSFTGWKEGTPAQRFMLDRIIHARCHVIMTMRSKMEYVLVEEVKNGRKISVPTKVGMAPEQRAGIEYEFTVVADMDLEHRLVVSKSRCDVIADAVAPKGRSADVAQQFAAWLHTGVQRVTEQQAFDLSVAFNAITDEDTRKRVKSEFVATFGLPADLLTDKLAEAHAWIAGHLPAAAPEPAPDAAPEQPVPMFVGELADAVADALDDDAPVGDGFDIEDGAS